MIKVKVDRLYEWIVALCVFMNGLGFVLYIAGVNVVNYLTVLAFAFIIMDLMRKNKSVSYFKYGNKWFIVFFFMFWVFYACVQVIFTDINQEYFSTGLHQLITNAMFAFMVCYTVHDRRSFNTIRNAMTGVLAVNTLMGIFEILTGIHFVEAESIWDANTARAFSNNPNEYATTMYCAMMGVVLFSLQGKLKMEIKLLLTGSVICIVFSHSRGILYAVIIFVLAYCAMKVYYGFKGNGSFFKLLFAMAIPLVCYIIVSGALLEIINWLVDSFSGKGDYGSDLYRINLIRDGMKFFRESHGFGVGAGQSIYLVKMNLHNFLVEILVEYGILIFTGILFILWYIWRMAFEPCISKNSRCIYFAFVPSLIMASISSSSINKFKIFWIMIIMFYLSGYYLSDSKQNIRQERNVYEAG